jgi:predicted ATPase
LVLDEEALQYRRSFLLHLQEPTGYDRPVLLKELGHEQASASHLSQLRNEYAITRPVCSGSGQM